VSASSSSPSPSWRLAALPPLDAELLRALFADLPVDVVVPERRVQAAATEALRDAELVVGDWSGQLRIAAAEIEVAPRLAFVQQPSAGVDTVDVAALSARGVPVANVGPANAVSVAEWCLGATFGVLRWLAYGDAAVRAGEWPQMEPARRGGGELTGRSVGIVGMGRIGVELARRYTALGCEVTHWSRSRRTPEEAGGAPWRPLDELLAGAQVLVVVVALAPETRGLIGAREVALLPRGAMVVNAARGGIVDEAALLDAVRSGALIGAALDVYDTEPLPADSPLRGEDRILLSPHAAGATPQSQGRLIDVVIDNVRRAIAGEPVRYVVNGVDPVVTPRPGA
jgi:phosphoglycerate dehydrogenase-like enzyme